MQLLHTLLSYPDIQAYLRQYAPETWDSVIAKILLYGIHSLQALHTAELQTRPIQILDISNTNDLDELQPSPAPLAQVSPLRVPERKVSRKRCAGKENQCPESALQHREVPRVLQPVELPLSK